MKQPDCSWTIYLDRLPNQGQGHTFVTVPNSRFPFPIIIAESVCSKDTLTQLAIPDVARLFAPGTGTRWWIGINILKQDPPKVTTWWAGHVIRDYDAQNNVWLDSYTFGPGSMSINLIANEPVTKPVTGLRFSVPVAFLLQPVTPPVGYPDSLHFDVEEIRKVAVECMR